MLDTGGIMKDVHEMLIIVLAPARVQLVRVSRFTPFYSRKKKISRTSRQTNMIHALSTLSVFLTVGKFVIEMNFIANVPFNSNCAINVLFWIL